MLINTSFNIRGEPIVASPKDAYECFMGTDMDMLVIGNYLLIKEEQPENQKKVTEINFPWTKNIKNEISKNYFLF